MMMMMMRRRTMKVEPLVREFSFNGVRLPDPNVNLSIEDVRNLYATAYPDITTAAIEGPEAVGTKLIYRFSRSIGTKG
jgi:PRTRC genetic system protein C